MQSKFFKTAVALLLVFALLSSSAVSTVSAQSVSESSQATVFDPIGTITKYIKVLLGFVEIGIDYITFDQGKNYPSTKEIKNALEEAKDTAHPFVLATKDEFDKVRASVNAGENGYSQINGYYEKTMQYVDRLLNDPNYGPLPYELDEDDAILEISRETLERMVSLGLAWQVTGDEKYAKRAWDEVYNVCVVYDDWHPAHFLDTAEMSLAMSVAYDWFFDYWNEEQKEIITNAVIEKGIEPARSVDHFSNWWVWSKTNWNSVCYGGIGIACMVFADAVPEDAAKHLAMAYKNMPINFCGFTPDGAYSEGPGYWEYGTTYLTYFIKTSKAFFGTDYGLSQYDGVEELGSFPVYISSPTGVFNYGDNKPIDIYSPALYWFSTEFNNKLSGYYQDTYLDSLTYVGREEARESALCSLWYDVSLDGGTGDFTNVPKCVHLTSDGSEELVVMRTAYLDDNATYAAIKGGYNYTNHGDLDIGTFVYDALGVRWAEELGPGNYSAPGYFVPTYGGGRWKLYEKRAEGQNTLVINPTMSIEDQFPFARAEFNSFSTTANGAVATLDMTAAYCANAVKKAVRTFELNGDNLTVTDDVECKGDSFICWGMHTKATAEIAADGRSAVLSIGDKKLNVTLNGDGTLQMLPAKSFTNPDYEYNKELDVNKLCVIVENQSTAHIEVTLAPQK